MFLYNLRPEWNYGEFSQDKVAFELFGMPVVWYALMILLAVVLSVVIGYFGYAKRLGATSDLLFEGVVVGVISGVVGGRLWYVIANMFEEGMNSSFLRYDFVTNLRNIINIRDGGLAISGAVILAGIGIFLFCKFRGLKILYILEIVMPLIMISQVLGRWGNFFNFEAHGGLIQVEGLQEALATSKILPDHILEAQRDFLWFLPDFIIDRMYINDAGVFGYCHPCFFYEGVLNFIGFTTYMIIRRVIKKGIYVGDGISFYLIWYGIVRFFIEMLRTDAQMIGDTGIKVVMVYTPIMILLGILWLVIRRVKKIQMISCYEALYGYDSSCVYEKQKNSKKKIQTQKHNDEVQGELANAEE